MFDGLPIPLERDGVFFNVFHPDDPIAYRIEPLLNQQYASVSPKTVPHYGGLRLHHKIRDWWRLAAEKVTQKAAEKPAQDSGEEVLVVHSEVTAKNFLDDGPGMPRQSTALDRMDYALQESAFESMNEFLSAIHSHFAYWECEDMVHFIADNTMQAVTCKHEAAKNIAATV